MAEPVAALDKAAGTRTSSTVMRRVNDRQEVSVVSADMITGSTAKTWRQALRGNSSTAYEREPSLDIDAKSSLDVGSVITAELLGRAKKYRAGTCTDGYDTADITVSAFLPGARTVSVHCLIGHPKPGRIFLGTTPLAAPDPTDPLPAITVLLDLAKKSSASSAANLTASISKTGELDLMWIDGTSSTAPDGMPCTRSIMRSSAVSGERQREPDALRLPGRARDGVPLATLKADVLAKLLLSRRADTAPRVGLDAVGEAPRWTIFTTGGQYEDVDLNGTPIKGPYSRTPDPTPSTSRGAPAGSA